MISSHILGLLKNNSKQKIKKLVNFEDIKKEDRISYFYQKNYISKLFWAIFSFFVRKKNQINHILRGEPYFSKKKKFARGGHAI